MTTIMGEPRWGLAAQAVVDGCIDLPQAEDRVALLAGVCHGLGDALYPALLRLLAIIGRHGDPGARAAVAATLVDMLRTGRLPSGRRTAWGATPAAGLVAAAYGSTRSLGPLEYLCSWFAQGDDARVRLAASPELPGLSGTQFESLACGLMELIATSPDARRLYCEKLLAEADDPLGGALTRRTREAVRALATTWGAGAAAIDASARFLAAFTDDGRRATDAVLRLPTLPR